MTTISCALVQVNVIVGALVANTAKIIRLAHDAAVQGAQIIIFPELAISGYPPEDLVLKSHFIDDCEKQCERLAAELPPECLVIVGIPLRFDSKIYNCAAAFQNGQRIAIYQKMLLPNYGVFDEKRVFAAGEETCVLEINGARVGLHICEDSWVLHEKPCTDLKSAGLDVLINISASPYFRHKLILREQVMHQAATFLNTHVLYCNLVGGQDELVFDGASMALDSKGNLIARAKQFEEDILFVKIPTTSASPRLRVENSLDDLAEVYAALKLGLADYVNKNGFSKCIVALSGGIDSALVATLAVDALGKDRVIGITMPSQFSSKETIGDAELLAKNLGIEFMTVPIQHLHQTYLKELATFWPGKPSDATEENLQARIRGNIVMALSNKFGWLVLTTGNKSELATGYCTLYGDMAGGFAVIKDVPKTLVFELAKWRNSEVKHALIPKTTITRPPSAELRPDQKDTDSLPPYEILDQIIERYVEHDLGIDQIMKDGFDAATVKRVIRMIDSNEYKRRQGAPGIKITPKSFGRDRRLPITNLYGERVKS